MFLANCQEKSIDFFVALCYTVKKEGVIFMSNTIQFVSAQKPLMVAHRGLSGLEKENTHAAFIAAGNRSYWGIETDIHRTADGKYVCIHDASTKRVGLDDINVELCTYDTLRNILLCEKSGEKGRPDIRIPSLEEYVRICKLYEKTCVLEIKGLFETEHLQEVLDIIAREDWLEHTVFIAFDRENLIRLRSIAPHQTAQFLTSGKNFDDPANIDDLCNLLNDYQLDLDIYFGALTAELSERVHKDGHVINVWTVDRLEDAEASVLKGVEYITTNILE